MPDQRPPKCPGSSECSGAGKWGATGRLPEGHLIYRHATGAYLAHGEPEDEPYLGEVPDVVRRIAAGEQPETQLAVDLVNAEAALARARAVYAPHLEALTVGGRRPERASECVCVGCLIIRALDGMP